MSNLEYSSQHVTIDAAIAAIKAMIAEFSANALGEAEESYEFQDGGSFEDQSVFSNTPGRYDLKITKYHPYPLHTHDFDNPEVIKTSDRVEYYVCFQQHNGYITSVKVICALPEETLDHEFAGVSGYETEFTVDESDSASAFIEDILYETIWFM